MFVLVAGPPDATFPSAPPGPPARIAPPRRLVPALKEDQLWGGIHRRIRYPSIVLS